MMSWKSSNKFGFKATSLISRSIVDDLALKAEGENSAAKAGGASVKVEVSARAEAAVTKAEEVAEISAKNHPEDSKSNYNRPCQVGFLSVGEKFHENLFRSSPAYTVANQV